jgi:hypothetical protein
MDTLLSKNQLAKMLVGCNEHRVLLVFPREQFFTGNWPAQAPKTAVCHANREDRC